MTPFEKWRWYWKSVPRTPQHGGGVSVWLFNWWTQRFTGPGKVCLVIWICLLAVAAIPGWNGAMVPLGVLFFGLLLGWVTTSIPLRLQAEWRFPRGITEKNTFLLTIDIHNPTRRTLKDVGAWFFWADEWLLTRGEPQSLQELQAGSSARIVVPMEAMRRGPHHLRGPLVYQLDPTGLFRRRRQVIQKTTVLVRPRPIVREWETFLLSGASGREFSRLILPQHHRSSELLGVREYRAGDELRDIHHKTWARLGKPFTKEFGKERGAGVILVVETGCQYYVERSGVDPMLRVVAGLVNWLGDRNLLGRFILDGKEVDLPEGLARKEEILDLLAAVPVPLWWKWPKPERFSPAARTLGPVLAIGCSKSWLVSGHAFAGGIQKRILVGYESPQDSFPSDQILWISAREAQ